MREMQLASAIFVYTGGEAVMKCRKNLRVLFAEYNVASAAEKPNTALMKIKNAILALKNPALRPSLLISRSDVVADIANDIAAGMLGPGSTLVSRYDDFVWAHHKVMMQGPNDPNGPNVAHRGPAFGPWHRELLKLYEQELQNAAGDPDLTLPYWDWTKDQSSVDPGFPFTDDFLGGNGAGNP
jgi:Common central domain of tyrosinase